MVMKRGFIFLVVLLIVSMGLMGKKLTTISEVFQPFLLVMDDQHAFKDDTLYQLVENEEEESWELHAHPIK
jgi:hypothetical protein